MSPPLIGITTYGRNEAGEFPLPAAYVDAIRRAGGIPLLLPAGEKQVGPLVDCLDGLVLGGGGDLDVAIYGGKPHEALYMVDEERDQSELALIQAFIPTNKPILCICRGFQLVNLFYQGSLIEHLPDEVGEGVLHRLPPRLPVPHPVKVKEDSRLADILGANSINPASWHHQGIRELGRGLEAVAWAPDQVIEAMEMKSHPWLIGVQWHPELTYDTDPDQLKLFQAFVQACTSPQEEP